jgi:hypothetical protein
MKRILASVLVTLSIVLASIVPAFAQTSPAPTSALDNFKSIGDSLGRGACLNLNTPNCSTISPDEKINATISLVINMFSIVVGVVAVIMIIIGGFKYITSGGDSGNVTGAKNTILYAVIGLVVVALAQFIVRFVLERALSTGTGGTGGGAAGA